MDFSNIYLILAKRNKQDEVTTTSWTEMGEMVAREPVGLQPSITSAGANLTYSRAACYSTLLGTVFLHSTVHCVMGGDFTPAHTVTPNFSKAKFCSPRAFWECKSDPWIAKIFAREDATSRSFACSSGLFSVKALRMTFCEAW